MVQKKQPVIQSVFDRKLDAGDDVFFQKAIAELEAYRRDLSVRGPTSQEHQALILNRDDRVNSLNSVYAGISAAESALRGVLASFEELSQDSIY